MGSDSRWMECLSVECLAGSLLSNNIHVLYILVILLGISRSFFDMQILGLIINAVYLEKKDLSDAPPLQECHVNHTWHSLFFFLNHQCGRVYQPIAVRLCK